MTKKMKLMSILIILLMISLPAAYALQISDVKIQETSDKFAKITWKTDELADSRIFYGTNTENLPIKKTDLEKTTEHQMLLTNLAPNTIYYFKVKSVNGGIDEDDNGGQNYAFQTLENDLIPPYIDVDVPEYSNRARIDIEGKTEPLTLITLIINGIPARKADPNDKGEFNFPNVELTTFQTNEVRIVAVDSSGNTNEKTFATTVDLTQPEITLSNLPTITDNPSLSLAGSISEESFLEIYINDELISANKLTIISESVQLNEGENKLRIRAIDRAGNADVKEYEVTLDTTVPTFSNILPEAGAFFYEGAAETDIEGDTEPFAKVELFIDKDPNGNPNAETTADENGHFEFDDVDLEGIFFAFIGVTGELETGYEPVSSEEAQEQAESLIEGQRGEDKPDEIAVKLTFVARDGVGHEVQEKITYNIGTCFAGGMNWGVQNLVEYQSPNLLSPERLEAGTEVATFILDLDYRGPELEPKVKNIRFDKACDSEQMLEDEKYKIACDALTNTPAIRQSNDDKTKWYIRYNLNKIEGLDDLSDVDLKDLTREFILPLKMKVEYNYQLPSGERSESKWQTSCTKIAFAVDTSRIDPRDHISGLLEKGIDFTEESVEKLGKIIKKVEVVRKYTATACFVGIGLKITTRIYRNWQAWTDYLTDKLNYIGDADDGKKCPKPGKKVNPELAKKIKIGEPLPEGATQADLTNKDFANRCEFASKAWKTEETAYKSFRWACDRYLSKGTPARWTASSSADEVKIRIEKSLRCTEEEGIQGTHLIKPKPDECEDKTGDTLCWTYKGAYYVNDYKGERTDEYIWLKRVKVKGVTIPFGAPPELRVIEEKGNTMLPETKKECKTVCKDLKYNDGACMDAAAASKLITDRPQVPHKTIMRGDCIKTDKPICICTKPVTTKNNPPNPPDDGEKEDLAKDEIEWNYRYDTVGYFYDKYIYHKGRDESACFGQDNRLFQGEAYLNPQEFIPAFQCLNINQIYARLTSVYNILTAMNQCFNKIKVEGKADAGVCKEIFTQYVCKWAHKLVTNLRKDCTPWSGTGKDQESELGDKIKAAFSSVHDGVSDSITEITSEYDDASIGDFLGAGEGTFAGKVCLGALTGDWGWDLEGFMDVTSSAVMHTSAAAFPADREFLTWNPKTYLATYDYRVAWMISPGCDMDYTVSLACVTDHELNSYDARVRQLKVNGDDSSIMGGDCLSSSGSQFPQGTAGPSQVIYTSRRLTQGTFQDGSIHFIDEKPYRYDNVKITVYAQNEDDAKSCIPEKNRRGSTGVFYSPLYDATTHDIGACKYDITAGTFKCSEGGLLMNQRGLAYFGGEIKCGGEDCKNKEYYVGDKIAIDNLEVYASGKKQCLYYEVKNSLGKVLNKGNRPLYPDSDTPSEFNRATNGEFILINEINVKEHLGVSQVSHNVDPIGSRPTRMRSQEGVVLAKEDIIYFLDANGDDGDEKGDKYKFNNEAEFRPYTSGQILEMPYSKLKFSFNTNEQKLGAITSPYKCSPITNDICKGFKITATGQSAPVGNSQQFKIKLQLRHAPGEENQQDCEGSVENDLISYQTYPQKKKFNPIVYARAGAARKCSATERNTRECDCDGDGIETDDAECYSGILGKYCVDGKCVDEPKQCEKDGKINTEPCICGGQANPICYDAPGGYCIGTEGICSRDKPN